ncbi:MAG: co-chaperone GroES [candidate division WWE3 bacterium]|nr:co-chaperone GroES [candidate division WWE3 bacterium]
MKLSIKPLSDNVLIEPMEREQQLPSGIVIPDTAKEKPQEGKVVAVGPGKQEKGELVKPGVKVGEHVLYKRYGGDEIKIEGKDYLMVSAEDILAVIGE